MRLQQFLLPPAFQTHPSSLARPRCVDAGANRLLIRRIVVLLVATWTASLAARAHAAQVDAVLSTRETYVGLPVTLQIRIINAADYEPPEIPEVDGLKITSAGTPGQSHHISIINGRRSETSSITYGYQVTAQHEGKFTIPPIAVNVDGSVLHTRQLAFVAAVSETGDLLFVEISGNRDEIYVGEPLELALKIWIRPFRDSKLGITLSEGQMWQCLSDQSSWGVFSDRLQELAAQNKRPAGTEVLRRDRAGDPRSYYLFEINATIYPQRPGRIDGDHVQVVVNYPTALRKSRSLIDEFFNDSDFPLRRPAAADDDFFEPLGSRLRVASYRPLVADAEVESVRVKAVPTAGRPSDYRGAVGQYKIITEASPIRVKAGDPITLRVGVVGTGPMDLVQAPPLAELKELTQDFKVPDEPLAGLVDEQQHTKLFSTSIRPRQAGATRIPGIPFSYFDPAAEKFITVSSQPISIEVEPADTLALDDIVSRQSPRSPSLPAAKSDELASTAAPVSFENYDGAELLVDDHPAGSLSFPMLLILAAPPIILLVVQIFQARGQLSQVANRCRSARRVCTEQIRVAEQPAHVGRALQGFLARKFRLKKDTADAATLGRLRTEGHGDLAIRIERILTACERSEAVDGGQNRSSLDQLRSEALEVVTALQALRPKPKVRSSAVLSQSKSTSTARQLIPFLILTCTVGVRGATAAERLSADQQQTVLQEANLAYQQARRSQPADTADIKLMFSTAAEKYQLLIEAGVRNSRLYFNLANANLQSGQVGRAIANYYRALQLDPTNQRYRTNLSYAQSLTKPIPDDPASVPNLPVWSWIHPVNDRLAAYVPPVWMRRLFLCSWVGFWGAIGIRLLMPTGRELFWPWKTTVVVCLLVAIVTGSSYALSLRRYSAPDLAVVVVPSVSLKEADGNQFPTVTEWDRADGSLVQVLQARSDWLRVQTPAGQTGWLPRHSLEVLSPDASAGGLGRR